MQPATPLPADFESSARRDGRFWLSLIFGLAVFGAGIALSRSQACPQGGSCASIVAIILQFVGGLLALYGIVLLWRNASRGSYFDPASGDLHWWHSRTVSNPGIAGKIHPKDIKCIILIKQDSREDEAILIGPDDFPVSGFDANAIPWRNDIWARQLVAAYPHIALEERS